MSKYFFCLSLLLLLFSCQKKVENTSPVTDFYDLKGYFNGQIQENDIYTSIHKVVSINGNTEKRTIDSVRWAEELNPFVSSDINRTSWKEKYRVDTMATINAVDVIYTALDEQLKTRLVHLKFQNDTLQRINIEQKSHNLIYSSSKQLSYTKNQGYEITGQQKTPFGSAQTYSVSVDFR